MYEPNDPHLTDAERRALAELHKAGDRGISPREIARRTRHHTWTSNGIEYANDVPAFTDQKFAEGEMQAAIYSLHRFGFCNESYDHGDRATGVVARQWIYVLSPEGYALQKRYRARLHNCCESAVVQNCVCREKAYCPEHGGGCLGSHD